MVVSVGCSFNIKVFYFIYSFCLGRRTQRFNSVVFHKHEQALPLENYGNEKFSQVLQARKVTEEGKESRERKLPGKLNAKK